MNAEQVTALVKTKPGDRFTFIRSLSGFHGIVCLTYNNGMIEMVDDTGITCEEIGVFITFYGNFIMLSSYLRFN